MADDATVGDGDATAVAKSPARITDTMTAVLNPDDPNTLKGPDPAEWPATQLIAPEDEHGDYEIKGPDPEKWPGQPGTVLGAVEPPT